MKKLLIILLMFLALESMAQKPASGSLPKLDSITALKQALLKRRTDSLNALKDSLLRRRNDSLQRVAFVHDSLLQVELTRFTRRIDTTMYSHQPFLRFSNPSRLISIPKKWTGKEGIFYCVVVLLLFFALVKNAFTRYLADLYKTFFRTTMKQRQVREQLINAPLPSLLFNILFLLAGGAFISLMLQHFRLGAHYGFWLLFAYSVVGLMVMYCVKFLVLKLMGWLLRLPEAVNLYIFIVFATNKVLGIALLPLVIALAFMSQPYYQMAFSLSLGLIGLAFLYRYYLSYVSVHRMVRINFFHFFLYLCAFEIAPLLVINKLLVTFFV